MAFMNEAPKKMYICDPVKNIECDGRLQQNCGVTCFCTTKLKYAKSDHPLTQEEYYKEEGIRMRLIGR